MIRHFNLNLFVNNKNNNDKKPTSKYSNRSPQYSLRKIKKNMILDQFTFVYVRESCDLITLYFRFIQKKKK